MNTIKNRLVPVKNCWVRTAGASERVGRVLSAKELGGDIEVEVRWFRGGEGVSTVPLSKLTCGFMPGVEVHEIPSTASSMSLGEGVVLKTRIIGQREQALVDFPMSGKQRWLPYENLSQVKGVKHRFIVGDAGPADSAERFRLKSLAYAIEMWNENTGSLSSLEIDPLPHQIHLVHHILASGNLNWMIADDVGLGKTIETGMLLAALRHKGMLKRVMLVTPAGLTKQWQDELNNKFRMGEFQIYGEDFRINEPRHWRMYDAVIASIDRLKDPETMESLMQSGHWDLIVFDEAHRLSRRQYGLKLDASQRFELAASLRNIADSMVLLTATPHQGKQDRFQSLLEILRPERRDEITTLGLNPEIIGDMVFRNNKADVTDSEGNFIFKGKTVNALRVDVSDSVRRFDDKLQRYLREGYEAAASMGIKGNAIGFVMSVYRKLSASSCVAIHQALVNRKSRLIGEASEESINYKKLSSEKDARYVGEWEESTETEKQEFFHGEMELLTELISDAAALRDQDMKMSSLIDGLIDSVLGSNPKEKVLIFTEYRSTQDYLRQVLETKFGTNTVSLINGSMTHQSRKEAIASFEDKGQFLVSTEAGGEGINLQSKCHIMVNYDLPWNPMRLVQRIGRLYRYGQNKRVVVFNMHSPDTVDEQIIELMYSRIDRVVEDLAGVSAEFNDSMRDDILGEVSDLLEVEKILEEATVAGISRTEDRIEEALNRAKDATLKQRELFEYAASYHPSRVQEGYSVSLEHVESFIEGMFSFLNIEVIETTHDSRVFHIRLPENIQTELGVSRSRYEVTLTRALALSRPGTIMLDMDSFLMQFLIEKAKSYEFMGLTAAVDSGLVMDGVAVTTSLLRWQNEQGRRLRQEFTVFSVTPGGEVTVNPESFFNWLSKPSITGSVLVDKKENKFLFSAIEKAADDKLQQSSNFLLHPENKQWLSSAWFLSEVRNT